MTINGVEQGCIKSQVIVSLIDVSVTKEINECTTADQVMKILNDEINKLRGEINGVCNS